eukprot:m.599455 g.599455  ORF g.599455 m.599455 type:complete len:590 (-) comp22425_c0_seq5:421-2190(-)
MESSLPKPARRTRTKHALRFVTLVMVVQDIPTDSSACTVLFAGNGVTSDGSTMVSHSDDGSWGQDARICAVPARNHAPGTYRNVYPSTEGYPRYVGEDRCAIYAQHGNQTATKPVGRIPQVPHTFAYKEGTYGIVNEAGVGIGESTCSGVFSAHAVGDGGKALLSIDELSRVALERATTSRKAVQIMGSLAEAHGFHGESDSFEGGAETLVVNDADEVFIFHVLADPTGTSAIWAAQRVPDNHVGVVANMFTIRFIDFSDDYNFLWSKSVQTVAEAKGWWTPGKPLDFTRIYSDGEYAHKFYSGRRMWGAYRRFGVSLPDNYTDLRYQPGLYPATAAPGPSATPDGVDALLLFAIHRDHYAGTPYDMTKGVAAGPWGNPDRWSTSSSPAATGNWERSISLYRTAYTHIVQARRSGIGAILWFAPHQSSTSCFAPIPASALVPQMYETTKPGVLDRRSAYSAHKYVNTVARIHYRLAIEVVNAAQHTLEAAGVALVKTLDTTCGDVRASARESVRLSCNATLVNDLVDAHTEQILTVFNGLPDTIVNRFGSGYTEGSGDAYPTWWLNSMESFVHGPPPVPAEPHAPSRVH